MLQKPMSLMQIMFGKFLDVIQWVITITYIFKQMLFSLLTFLKVSEKFSRIRMISIHAIIIQLQTYPGTQCSKQLELSSNS